MTSLSVARREAARDIMAICRHDLDSRTLRARIAARLRRAIPQDAFCFGAIDPWTLLVTDELSENIPPSCTAPATRNEYLIPDVDKFSVLARSGRTTAILSQSTGGNPTESHRFRTVLPLIDARHEMRAVFVVDGRCWGGLAMFRNGRHPDFTHEDADLIRAVSVPVAAALRRAACRPGETAGVTTDP
ncbi:GAF domain-containing protein [Thermopolyspora sp. NPDC052614]|uniref:GAF domain-containing protein n=1 Tax=Thermopolyspora sp. NPDC052614 TaxID=3155682 RepID=UPI0034213787